MNILYSFEQKVYLSFFVVITKEKGSKLKSLQSNNLRNHQCPNQPVFCYIINYNQVFFIIKSK